MHRLALILLIALLHDSYAGRENLLRSDDLTRHPISDYLTVDRDQNNVMIELDDAIGDLIFRLDSMPTPGEHGIENTRENNLALTPYIPNTKSARYIEVTFQYDHGLICPTYAVPDVQCKDAFHFAVLTAASDQINLRDTDLDNSSAVIQSELVTQSIATTASQSMTFTVNLPAFNPGFRVAFLDKGSRFDIKTLRINQYICNLATFQYGLLTCPEVSARSNETRDVQCECDSVTSEPDSTGSNFVQCLTNGDYNSASVTTPCKCKPGYSFVSKPGAPTQFECQAVTTAQPQTTTTSSTGANPSGSNSNSSTPNSLTPSTTKDGSTQTGSTPSFTTASSANEQINLLLLVSSALLVKLSGWL